LLSKNINKNIILFIFEPQKIFEEVSELLAEGKNILK